MHNSVEELSKKMQILAKDFKSCRKSLTALGDENRQHIIVALLKQYGGLRVGDITKQTNLSRPAVSHHLKILKEAGIVSMYKKGTMNFYHINGDEKEWTQLISLMDHISDLLIDVSHRKAAGIDCPCLYADE